MTAMTEKDMAKLKGCHPDLARKVDAIIADLKGYGWTVCVTEGVRSKARQLWLWAFGRTAPGPKRTWTLTSNHFVHADGFGHAADLAFVVRGKASWDKDLPWHLIGRSAEAHGLAWGGRFRDKRGRLLGDFGHVELKG